MKDEIKKIITEMQLRNGRYIICKNEDISFSDEDYKAHLLLDYITNLQDKIKQYEDPEDLTLFYMWLDEKAKDKMKQLQDRIKELEQINEEHRKLNGELRAENKELKGE